MKYADLAVGTELYTGSRRIFAIRCYLEQHRWVWERYLMRLRYSRKVQTIDASTWKHIEEIIVQYHRQADTIGENEQAWGPAVVFVAILEQLAFRFVYDLSVAAVLQELFRRQGWPPGSLELVRYAEGVENKSVPLETEFYSVMGQPIQFFGTLKTALVYSRYVYKYVVEEPLRVVDISDRATSQELLDTVFTSWEPYSDGEIKYYCGPGENAKSIRINVLYWLTRRTEGGMETVVRLLDQYYGKRKPYKGGSLGVDWSAHYEHELCSPRGLWIASQLKILLGVSNRRYDGYMGDALIVKTFTTGTGLDGWYNAQPQEWMIYHPERYGELVPLHDYPFNGPDCKFYLPSPHRPAEPDAPENPNAIEPEVLIAESPDY